MSLKSDVQWKFRLCFDFDTFLVSAGKPSYSLWEKVFFKPCLSSWKYKCSIIVGAGETENVKQDLKCGYKRLFIKQTQVKRYDPGPVCCHFDLPSDGNYTLENSLSGSDYSQWILICFTAQHVVHLLEHGSSFQF